MHNNIHGLFSCADHAREQLFCDNQGKPQKTKLLLKANNVSGRQQSHNPFFLYVPWRLGASRCTGLTGLCMQ